KRAYCLKTQPATGETYPKSDLFNKAIRKPQPTLVKAIRGLLSILNHMATMDLSGPDNKKEVICHYSNRMKIWSS
ncbi:hypothetical protein, partial [Citrobacter freundii]|uniref:hypothetical protein n=1 Tax=Citrobacter freundii TaxID=546 RepID=UPI0038BDFCC5